MLLLLAFCALGAVFADVGSFIHITDMHIDVRYAPGSPSHCIEDDIVGVGCCHAGMVNSTKKPNHPCSIWGDYNCDASPHWIQNVLLWAGANPCGGTDEESGVSGAGCDFVIATGDYASHHDITQTPWENEEAVSQITRYLADAFPGKKLLNVMGNHDGWPVDNTVPFVFENMLANVSNHWAPYLDSSAADMIKKGGYYSILVAQKLRFISINILWFDSNNVFFKNKQNDLSWDPAGTWVFLNDTLRAARAAGEKVWLGYHFGPEAGETSYNYNVRLTELMDMYQDIIPYTFCGHTHSNQFMVFQTSDKRSVAACWAPGALYASGHNPQFNVYRYDRQTGVVLDFDHYECDLNKTIANNAPDCRLAFTFSRLYELSAVNTTTLEQVAHLLATNDTLLQHYHAHCEPGDNFDNDSHPDAPCDARCRDGHLNDIFHVAPARNDPFFGLRDQAQLRKSKKRED